jgi:hypothetical protein
MSVPLDRLYNHLDGLCNHDILIYRFYPHGSKKLTDLLPLKDFDQNGWENRIKNPGAICHDQEPLFFDQYSETDMLNFFISYSPKIVENPDSVARVQVLIKDQHLRSAIGTRYSIYDKTILVHSEQNSPNLVKYENVGFVGVYWWTHAAIAIDWYRYAQYDSSLIPNFDSIQKDFLIYNRAWTGTREYRLKFTELLVNTGLHEHCITTFNTESEGKNYKEFSPKNSAFKIQRNDLQDYFNLCTVDANASADYNNQDYQHSAIEVVLETLFDDTRWHLTEKSLRPIACGRPFMLAATPGSLQYLRNYGFKTFDGLVDESYDNIVDPVQRLEAICIEMQRISQLTADQKQDLREKLYSIAKYNQQLFFSKSWQELIFDEFTANFKLGMDKLNQSKTGKYWRKFQQSWTANPEQFKLADASSVASMQHQIEVEQLISQQSRPTKSI